MFDLDQFDWKYNRLYEILIKQRIQTQSQVAFLKYTTTGTTHFCLLRELQEPVQGHMYIYIHT